MVISPAHAIRIITAYTTPLNNESSAQPMPGLVCRYPEAHWNNKADGLASGNLKALLANGNTQPMSPISELRNQRIAPLSLRSNWLKVAFLFCFFFLWRCKEKRKEDE